MKKIGTIAAVVMAFMHSHAQDTRTEEKPVGFNVNNVFVGSSLTLGYSSGNNASTFIIGANPEVGYSFAQWLDLGVVFNAIYNSTKFTDGFNRYRQTAFNYGVGGFVRIHPFNSFFVTAQPEQNWIKYTQTNLDNNFKISQTVKASSFLVGAGYGSRFVGQSNFFTVIMFDLNNDLNSPYLDSYGNKVPIIRGGINFYLGAKKKR